MNRSLSGGIKLLAMQANENGQPTDLRFGTVISTAPLKVQVTPNFIIPSSLLVVPQYLTNHTVTVDTDWVEGSDESKVEGDTIMRIYNALKIGDKVALLRKQGGQSYFILDRI